MAGTVQNPLPADTGKTEPKVKVSAVAQYLVGLVLVAVVSGAMDGNLVSLLPDWASSILLPILPAVAGWLAAYNTRHQFRVTETTNVSIPATGIH